MKAFNLFDALFPTDRDSRVAVLYEHRGITYAELRDEVVRAAEILSALGVGAGDRVAILLYDSPEFIASFVGAISLGAIAVPINTALRKGEQRSILRDSGARAAVVEADAARGLLEDSEVSSREHRIAGGLPELTDLLLVSRTASVTPIAIAGVHTRSWNSAPREQIPGDFPLRANEASPAFILYTSGSTGEPKGAIHRQADIDYTNRTYCAEVLHLREGDRLFSSSRLPFAYGLGNSFTFPLLNGFTSVLCREKPLPEVINRIFAEYQPTIFFGVPVVYRLLLDHHRNVSALDCSSLRLCVSAGEALPAQLGEQWQRTFGVEVLDGIGSTEMLHMFMSNHEGQVRYGSSGRLLCDYDARLVDYDGNPTPVGDVGNLWVRGASAAIAYWQRPETTAQTFVDGWVRTGDLYRSDDDGFWWHMGRGDDCFKPTGQWVSPIEIESVLLRHEAVGRAAVVEGFDDHGLSCVCAFVVPQDGAFDQGSLEAGLRTLCETVLPRFKQPRRYIFVPDLPYTATGKVQRFKLREQLRAARDAVAK